MLFKNKEERLRIFKEKSRNYANEMIKCGDCGVDLRRGDGFYAYPDDWTSLKMICGDCYLKLII